MRRLLLCFAVAVLGLVSAATSASALGLDLLSSGGSITSGNGGLTFADFDVVTTGSVRGDLALYDVQALVDGFAISGPISAADGDAGDLFIQFTVTARSAISGARLSFNGAASQRGSSASVTETFEEVSDAQLFVFATGGGGRDLTDSLSLEGFTRLRVSKDILVASSECNGIAVISRVEQHFTTEAPEPAALLLLGTAFMGLVAGRKRLA